MAEWRTVVQEISAFIQADELLPHLAGNNLRVVPTPAPRKAFECSSPLTLGEAVLVSCNFGQARLSFVFHCNPLPPLLLLTLTHLAPPPRRERR